MEKISKSQVKLVKSLQIKKFRDQLGLFVAEGEKCVGELTKSFELVHLYREGENASRTEIEQMSSLRTPQGVIAVFKKRPTTNEALTGPTTNDKRLTTNEALTGPTTNDKRLTTNDLTLALDGVQDPGNLGTIIRTCDWFGVHDIVCSLDTADCYNPKVVQATMGALSRVRVHYVDLPAWLQSQITNHQSPIAIYGTLLDGRDMYDVLQSEGRSCSDSGLTGEAGLTAKRSIVVMGNEGNGISPAVRSLVTHPIRIPSYPKNAETSESLNVSIATAIVLSEFRRIVL